MSTDNANSLLIDKVKTEIERLGLSQAKTAKLIGISDTKLSQWLGNKYPGRNDELTAKIEIWLQAQDERHNDVMSMPTAPKWTPMPTSKKIMATFSYIQMAQVMGIVYGGAGMSKTYTSEYYALIYPNVWHVELTADAGSKLECAREIAQVMGLSATGTASQLRRDIVAHAKNTNGLIIMDEAQFLKPVALEMMRGIWRQAGVGVVFVGNEIVYSQLTGGRRAPEFAQLFSRMSKRQRINKPMRGDVNNLAQEWGITTKKELDLLWAIATKNGALRSLTEVLRLASMYANNEKITATYISSAWTELGSNN